jgi:two-component system sensor histidine kinase RpfC
MCLTQAVVAARHLSFVINDVLDLAALESGRLSLQIRDHWLHELLPDVRQVMGLAASANGIELRVDEPADALCLRTDRGRFLQITFNLLGNAIKYSTHGGRIELRVRQAGDRLRFEVLDSGEGVPPQYRDRLFTRFGRAHSANHSDVGGTGLGLHLCSQLVELQEGAIGYEPRSPRGSVFWFELPRSATAAHTGQTVAETIITDR